MVTRRTGRLRGRPTLEFLDDPDRYRLALAAAVMVLYGLKFEPAARLALCTEGKPMSPGQSELSRTAQKRLQEGWVLQSFQRPDPRQTIDAQIDSLRLKWNRLASEAEHDAPALRWLTAMRNAWLVLFDHERYGGPAAGLLILRSAEAAGEGRYAEDFMLPFLHHLLTAMSPSAT